MSIDSIEEVMRSIKSIGHEEIRRESKTYLEIVFNSEAMGKIKTILEDYYGPAFKRAGANSGREADKFCKEYGGIQKEQELYYKNYQGVLQLAMIWPWHDGHRSTIKIIQTH